MSWWAPHPGWVIRYTYLWKREAEHRVARKYVRDRFLERYDVAVRVKRTE